MPPRLTTPRRISPFVISTRHNLIPQLHGHDVVVAPSPPSVIFPAFFFSTTTKRHYARSHEPTYYEILNVPVTATAAEIKKQFYALSLKHHPDRNRTDPKATERFATISSAYHTLGDSTKRARYDLDHGIGGTMHGTHSSGVAGQHPMGSHSSAGATYAGSRPASGLSKRRTAFRGPPPSFYAHGGYGGRATRRQQQQSPGSYTGTGHPHNNEDPTSFINHNPVWHFNARGHYKTQAAEDARRKQRRSQQIQREREILESERGGSFILRFVIVSGILVITAAFGALLGRSSTPTATPASGRTSEKSAQSKGLGTRVKEN